MNIFKYSSVYSLLVFVSLNAFADDSWGKQEVNMQCGPAIVNIAAECKADPDDTESNICKKITMKISQGDKIFSSSLPYMSAEQMSKLERQHYRFTNIVSSVDWAPQKMYCINKKYILIGYWNGMNDAEKIDGSLSANVTAPIFDFNGFFLNEKESRKLREEVSLSPKDTTYINFVYGDN